MFVVTVCAGFLELEECGWMPVPGSENLPAPAVLLWC